MIHATASDAPELYRLAVQIAILSNPVLFWDVRQMDDLERRALLEEVKSEMQELMS